MKKIGFKQPFQLLIDLIGIWIGKTKQRFVGFELPIFGWRADNISLDQTRPSNDYYYDDDANSNWERDTFADHANVETLLKPAELTAIASSFVHLTGLAGKTYVLWTLLYCPLFTINWYDVLNSIKKTNLHCSASFQN